MNITFGLAAIVAMLVVPFLDEGSDDEIRSGPRPPQRKQLFRRKK